MSMEWRGDRIIAKVADERRKALKKAAEMVLTKAQQVAPVDTGELVRSATINYTENGDHAELSFNTAYAHRQHEDLSYTHPQGQAKYLEQPLRENADAVLKSVGQAVARGFKG